MNMQGRMCASRDSDSEQIIVTREHRASLMTNPFVRKLSYGAELSADDHLILRELIRLASTVERGNHLFRERDALRTSFVILEGWAVRYKMLPDGRRQIVGLLVPGDLSDVHASLLDRRDHNLAMLSAGRVVAIAPETMRHVFDNYPAIARALNWTTLVEQAVLHEWLTSLGQRDAVTRIAHLFVELWLRVRAVGLVKGQSFKLPMTQADLGDALGLTSVHVNRQLQLMRKAGLITLDRQTLTIHDPSRLAMLCDFDSSYLQLGENNMHLVAVWENQAS